jgi:hypothetical protein
VAGAKFCSRVESLLGITSSFFQVYSWFMRLLGGSPYILNLKLS